MNPLARMTAAVIAVVLLIGTGAYLLGPGPQNGGTPTSSPSISATALPASSATASASRSQSVSPSVAPVRLPSSGAGTEPDTTAWVAYTSNRYGFDISHPADWTERPATGDWTMAEDGANFLSGHAEGFMSPDFTTYASAFAVDLPDGEPSDEWITAYQAPSSSGCKDVGLEPAASEPGTVDGRPATISHSCQDSMAFVVIGDRIYVFVLSHQLLDSLEGSREPLLRAFVSTVHFRSLAASPVPS